MVMNNYDTITHGSAFPEEYNSFQDIGWSAKDVAETFNLIASKMSSVWIPRDPDTKRRVNITTDIGIENRINNCPFLRKDKPFSVHKHHQVYFRHMIALYKYASRNNDNNVSTMSLNKDGTPSFHMKAKDRFSYLYWHMQKEIYAKLLKELWEYNVLDETAPPTPPKKQETLKEKKEEDVDMKFVKPKQNPLLFNTKIVDFYNKYIVELKTLTYVRPTSLTGLQQTLRSVVNPLLKITEQILTREDFEELLKNADERYEKALTLCGKKQWTFKKGIYEAILKEFFPEDSTKTSKTEETGEVKAPAAPIPGPEKYDYEFKMLSPDNMENLSKHYHLPAYTEHAKVLSPTSFVPLYLQVAKNKNIKLDPYRSCQGEPFDTLSTIVMATTNEDEKMPEMNRITMERFYPIHNHRPSLITSEWVEGKIALASSLLKKYKNTNHRKNTYEEVINILSAMNSIVWGNEPKSSVNTITAQTETEIDEKKDTTSVAKEEKVQVNNQPKSKTVLYGCLADIKGDLDKLGSLIDKIPEEEMNDEERSASVKELLSKMSEENAENLINALQYNLLKKKLSNN